MEKNFIPYNAETSSYLWRVFHRKTKFLQVTSKFLNPLIITLNGVRGKLTELIR